MKSATESFLRAERSVQGAMLFKIRGQASRNCDLIVSGCLFIFMNTGNTELPTKSAAVYVRKSKKHRQFSISNQARAIRKYAKHQGLRIEKVYFDAAKQPIGR